MARKVHKLTVLEVKSKTEPGRYSDGDGLYLYVSKHGGKSWVFRYRDRTTAKLRDKGLGSVRSMTLEQARASAGLARNALANGTDPIEQKREEVRQRAKPAALTFGECADRYIETHRVGWSNAKHAAQWRSTLQTCARALLSVPVSSVDTDGVMSALLPIWITKTETASRVRQRIEAVLDWATASKFRAGDNPARLRGHLDNLLPNASKVKRVKPRPALPYSEISRFMAELRGIGTLAAKALELQILTAARPGEIVGARWSEIDLGTAIWTIPAERMKSGRPHRVPLSAAAVTLLAALPRMSEYVFPGGQKNHALTTAAPLKLLRTIRPGIVPHGFRSTFRDWCADCTAYPREVAEESLAHVLKDKTEAAYRRTDLLTRRARLMSEWAQFCEAVPIESAAVAVIGRIKSYGNSR